MIRFYSFVLCTIIYLGSLGQVNYPSSNELFADNVLPSVFITIDSDSLDELLDHDNRYSNHHFPATFIFDNGTVRDTMQNVGFRLRGNTSRSSQKKSFKVSFNTFESGAKYRGVEKLNLNGEHNDPSIIRSKLCWDFYEHFHVPASRSNHVKLYINGNYFGLYINVEHIDEEFTKSRFESQGNLYKCTWGADLSYKGQNPSSYKLDHYELKSPNSPTAYEDLAHFIDVLNNTPANKFECELEQVFNVNTYIKSLVVDILTGHWDGPNFNKNNFYLFYNLKTKQFEFIPYDLDNTFGIDWANIDWASRDMYQWSPSNSVRPLYDKILASPVYKERFSYFLDEIITSYYNSTSMNERIDQIKTMINSAAYADTYRNLDYGYSNTDFDLSYTQALSGHVKYGLKPFIADRISNCQNQVNDELDIGPIPGFHSYSFDFNTNEVILYFKVKENYPLTLNQVNINWDFQSSIWSYDLVLYDTLRNIYSVKIPWSSGKQQMAFNFELKDTANQTVYYPSCNMFSIKYHSPSGLVINEIMASNTSVIADGNGEFDDWIEIYNPNSSTGLKGYYLTDNISDPFKWALPDMEIGEDGFVLFWADNDEGQGSKHTNFKLSAAGEEVALFDSIGSLVDMISFGNQSSDISYGRRLDADSTWINFESPTPGYSNNPANNSSVGVQEGIRFFPNPASNQIQIIGNTSEWYSIIDGLGKEVQSGYIKSNIINLESLAPGLYTLHLQNGSAQIVLIR